YKKLAERYPNHELEVQAKKVLENILHHYSNFHIQTIDAFFQKVVRAFARELELQIGYELELDTDLVLSIATDSMLNKINNDGELAGFLEEFVFNLIEKDKGWYIEPDIKFFGRELFKDRYYNLLESLGKDDVIDKSTIRNIIAKLNYIVGDFENTMTGYSNRTRELMSEYSLNEKDFFHGKSGVAGYLLHKISKKKDYKPTTRVFDAHEHDDNWTAKGSNKKKTVLDCLNGGLRDVLNGVIAHFNDNYKQYI